MFGLSTSLPSDSGSLPLPGRPASADELLREVAACRKRSNILLALTQQELADAKEWLARHAADEARQGRHPSAR
jgi:hypothetical protein